MVIDLNLFLLTNYTVVVKMPRLRYLLGSPKFRELFANHAPPAPISLFPCRGSWGGTHRIFPRVGLPGTVTCAMPKHGDSTTCGTVCVCPCTVFCVWCLLQTRKIPAGFRKPESVKCEEVLFKSYAAHKQWTQLFKKSALSRGREYKLSSSSLGP